MRYDKVFTIRVDSTTYNKLIKWKEKDYPTLTIPEFFRLMMDMAYLCPGHTDIKTTTTQGDVVVGGGLDSDW